jgi:3-phosphoshikimate 1-carboxyvinyltransferase
MKALLKKANLAELNTEIAVTGSKSESNRLLLLQAIYPAIQINNRSESDDTKVLQEGLKITQGSVDVHHAGTAMRFLTAYFAAKDGAEVLLSGSDRMHQRPIKILVDALRDLGALIEYVNEEGYPPLRIFGKKLIGDKVSIRSNVSSQYISALLLIAPSLPNGLTLELEGVVTSVPYIEMTLSLLEKLEVSCSFSGNTIKIEPKEKVAAASFTVESDWSSASYFYSAVALSNKTELSLKSYSEKSLQGDAALASIYKALGVNTIFNTSQKAVTLFKSGNEIADFLSLNLSNTPDIAQTIAITCFGLGIGCKLTGLHTLKIKETDRLSALKNELEKLGAVVAITSDSLEIQTNNGKNPSELNNTISSIETYQDHRMAMAFAPLGWLFPLVINDPMVVTKSFPRFWEEMVKLGLTVDFQ